MKYIVIKEQGVELPILFPEVLNHALIANWVNKDFPKPKCISAGFAKANTAGASVWGESVTLKLKSRPEDADLIEHILGVGSYRT